MPEHMKAEGISRVGIYEIKVVDTQVAGSGRTVRMAREMAEEVEFNIAGQPVAQRIYASEEKLKTALAFSYDDAGLLVDKVQTLYGAPNVNLSDIPWEVQLQTQTISTYAEGRLQTQHSTLPPGGQMNQASSYRYDPQGRLLAEVVTSPSHSLTRTYNYLGRDIVVEEWAADKLLRRERVTLDAEGRLWTHAYHPAGQEKADLTEWYSYDANGRLETVRYAFDRAAHDSSTVLLSQHRSYDKQGKLSETKQVYGDGRSTLRWYSYGFFHEEE
jgi:hypothetical protein